jgi:hypothetical protein
MDKVIEVERDGKLLQLVHIRRSKENKRAWKFYINVGDITQQWSRIEIPTYYTYTRDRAVKYFYSVLDDLFKLDINATNK